MVWSSQSTTGKATLLSQAARYDSEGDGEVLPPKPFEQDGNAVARERHVAVRGVAWIHDLG